MGILAEKEGFEPSVRCRTLPFQGSAIDHSAISPELAIMPLKLDFVQKLF
jgi:hypothetical protein